MQLQTVMTVGPDGKSAKARWRTVIQAGVLHTTVPWGEGACENEYIKENGVWKFKSLHFFLTYSEDCDKGRDKCGNAAPVFASVAAICRAVESGVNSEIARGVQPDRSESVNSAFCRFGKRSNTTR
jgi:hypothetical protein